MEKQKRLHYLIQEVLALLWLEWLAHLLHVLLEVELKVLEHQVQLILREQDLLQATQKWQKGSSVNLVFNRHYKRE